MKLAIFLCLITFTLNAAAQEVNPIIGIWKRNNTGSTTPGASPMMEVREYRARPDGYLTGLAVWVGANGKPGFLQFTAKSDGNFYPEHDSFSLSELQANGQETDLAYSEKFTDASTIEWVDQSRGVVTASGTKTFSEDGKKMYILVNVQQGTTTNSYTLVYDKQ